MEGGVREVLEGKDGKEKKYKRLTLYLTLSPSLLSSPPSPHPDVWRTLTFPLV